MSTLLVFLLFFQLGDAQWLLGLPKVTGPNSGTYVLPAGCGIPCLLMIEIQGAGGGGSSGPVFGGASGGAGNAYGRPICFSSPFYMFLIM